MARVNVSAQEAVRGAGSSRALLGCRQPMLGAIGEGFEDRPDQKPAPEAAEDDGCEHWNAECNQRHSDDRRENETERRMCGEQLDA
jgi:hypothetical protein